MVQVMVNVTFRAELGKGLGLELELALRSGLARLRSIVI